MQQQSQVKLKVRDEAKAERVRLASDRHRPQYHFLPPANWMNDPNGFIQWQGEYHLFYQHNPNGAFWGTMHWGHAVSRDLVHWADLPIALVPSTHGPDTDGCFSGCAVNNQGVPTLIYTGVQGNRQTQCIATSKDGLLTWKKRPGNPVLASPPNNVRTSDFRDPYVWRENDVWFMVVGSAISGIGGATLLYSSPDLVTWEYQKTLLVGNLAPTNEMWECPNFFPLGDKHILIVSVTPKAFVHYFIGSYEDGEFIPETEGKISADGSFYAPLVTLDDHERRVMVGWLDEGRSKEAQQAAGWAGVLSLPRILSLRSDGMLGIEPAPELKALRGEQFQLPRTTLSPEVSPKVLDLQGDKLEIIAEFEPGNATEYGIIIRSSPNSTEKTSICFNTLKRTLSINTSYSSLDPDVEPFIHENTLNIKDGESLKLHIFLDHSVLEVFANSQLSLTSRIYPTQDDSLGVALFANGTVTLKALDAWPLHSIWPA